MHLMLKTPVSRLPGPCNDTSRGGFRGSDAPPFVIRMRHWRGGVDVRSIAPQLQNRSLMEGRVKSFERDSVNLTCIS